MNDSTCGAMVATIVLEFMKLYDEGKVSLEETRRFVSHCVNVAQQWGGNIEEVFSLIPDRCTCCFRKKQAATLIRWNTVDITPPDDPNYGIAEVAYNNCFGEQMTGGRVCFTCLMSLPKDGPADVGMDTDGEILLDPEECCK